MAKLMFTEHSTLPASGGRLYVNKLDKEGGLLSVNRSGIFNDYNYLGVNGLIEINPSGTLNVKSGSQQMSTLVVHSISTANWKMMPSIQDLHSGYTTH